MSNAPDPPVPPLSPEPPSQHPAPALDAAPSPSPQRRFAERRFDGPRRVKHGLKLSSREGPVVRNALAARWMALIEQVIDAERMQQGLEYARSGQVVSLQVLAGEIDSHVQGTAPRPYVSRIGVPALDEARWQAIVEAMAGEAIHVAKLLSGELPPGVDELFTQHEAALVPNAQDVRLTCTCAAMEDGATGGCKHLAAAAHMLADQLSDQPLLIFTLLGLPIARLTEQLRQARTLHTYGVASAHDEAGLGMSSAPAPLLETVLEDFWRGAGDADEIANPSPRQSVKHALLRRLGPSPLQGKFPMVGLLASIYDAVVQAARQRNDAPADPPSAAEASGATAE